MADQWNNTANSIALAADEFSKGLWRAEIDLLRSRQLSSEDLTFLDNSGRPSLNSAFNPDVTRNPAEETSRESVGSILVSLLRHAKPLDDGSRQSFLYDLQRLILPVDWHKATVVVGSVKARDTLAFSPLVVAGRPDDICGVFELYDTFFSSLKYTRAYRSQLALDWVGECDLMSSHTETFMGLA